MNQLFNCKNIKWTGYDYEEILDEEILANNVNIVSDKESNNDSDNDYYEEQ